MPIKSQKLESILLDKFKFSPAKGHSSDHLWFELKLDGLHSILTKISHSRPDIDQNLEGLIVKQLRVRKPFFREMLDCTKSKEEYYQQVHDDPYPPWDVRF